MPLQVSSVSDTNNTFLLFCEVFMLRFFGAFFVVLFFCQGRVFHSKNYVTTEVNPQPQY